MTFRRLTTPGYTGGLPGGYAYINNAVAGTPALVAGVLVGPAVDAGSFFLGRGEPAASASFNRSAAALAENTDYLDDLLRRDVAVPVQHTTNNLTLPIGTYLGTSLITNNAAGYRQLFTIIDTTTLKEAQVEGAPAVVTAVALGGGGDAIGSGLFSTGTVTLTITAGLAGSYAVIYFGRSNLATHPSSVWLLESVRSQIDGSAYLTSSWHASTTYTSGTTVGSTNQVTLPAGSSVVATTSGATHLDLYTITDAVNQAIIIAGVTVAVVSIDAGTETRGFADGSRVLTLNATLPGGTAYRIHRGTGASLYSPGDADTDLLVSYNRLLRLLNSKPSREADETIFATWSFTNTTFFDDVATFQSDVVFTGALFSCDATNVVFGAGTTVDFNSDEVNLNMPTFVWDELSITTGGSVNWSTSSNFQIQNTVEIDFMSPGTGTVDFNNTVNVKFGTASANLQYRATRTVKRRPAIAYYTGSSTLVPLQGWSGAANTVGVDQILRFDLKLPHGVTNIHVYAVIDPATAVEPADKCAFRLRSRGDTGVASTIETFEDPAVGAAYTASHTFDHAFSHTFDAELSYVLEIMGELAGANANNVDVARVYYTYDVGNIDLTGQ